MVFWERTSEFWLTQWDFQPERALLIVGLAAWYLANLVALARREVRIVRAKPVTYFIGLTVLALAIASPLHRLSDSYLFSAHMVQHELLTLVVPPLLLLGVSPSMVWWLESVPGLAALGRTHLYPVVAYGTFHILFSFVHFPRIYDAVFANGLAHFLVHAGLLVLGLAIWFPLFSPVPYLLPRLSLPGAMLFCFLQTIPGTLVGALITLSEQVTYHHYGAAPEAFGISPLADQQLGGLIMWVVGGTYFLVVLTVLFFVWADREEVGAYG